MPAPTKPNFTATEVFDISTVSGIGAYDEQAEPTRYLYKKSDKVFLVINRHTLELRTDAELRKVLKEKYESVMDSRYFGHGGIEIVLAGHQFTGEELADLIRLSYNLS